MNAAGGPEPARHTWSPAEDAELPDLTALPGVVGVGTPPARDLVATYLDTADLALVRAGISLCRRRGGDDEGWHLTVPGAPGDAGRAVVRRPLGADEAGGLEPPTELRRMVEARAPGALVAVAEVCTQRAVHDLRAPGGRVLATLTDDRETARALRAGDDGGEREPVGWRAWELRLVDGDPGLLAAAADVVDRAGVPPSMVAPAADVALGERWAALLAVAAEAEGRPLSAAGPAGEVLRARLVAQACALLRHDAGMRCGRAGSLHEARVACRRLRAALATYRPLVDRSETDPLREELRWFARSLGEARDAEVARELLDDLLDAEPPSLVPGPAPARLESAFGEEQRRARALVAEVLGSARYLGVLDDLERLVAEPPWTGRADEPAAAVLLPRVRREMKRLRRRVDAAWQAEPAEYDEALHEARKAAKRLRYACEALEPVWGPDAERLRKAATQVTRVLGERQDTTVSRERLLGVAAEAEEAGESTFVWGRLHGREQARSDERAREFWERSWPAARRKKLRRWLRP